MPSKEELLANAQKPVEESGRLHALYKGKIQSFPKCPSVAQAILRCGTRLEWRLLAGIFRRSPVWSTS